MLGIDFRDSKPRAQAFHRRYGWTWPSLWDPRGRLAAKVKALGTPTVVFLDRRHRVVARIAGGADLADLEDTYRRHLR
jgi:cytochrome c biogenesis protein CcmG/thiol:disulfide interchange protein DsbE